METSYGSIRLDIGESSQRPPPLKRKASSNNLARGGWSGKTATVGLVVGLLMAGGLSAFVLLGFLAETPISQRQYESLGMNREGKCSSSPAPLVILSFDGFSREYLDRHIFQSLQFIAERGVRAEFVVPSFQAKTFPNHFTIATGLYPGFHGIVDAMIFDPEISDDVVDVRKADADPRFYEYGGEPIWAAYQRLTNRKVACFHYPGCAHYPYYKPQIVEPFTQQSKPREIFDKVLLELLKPRKVGPGLVMAYFDEPDHTRHSVKGDSPQVNRRLELLEGELKRFLAILEESDRLDCINLVILSDHGFMDISRMVNVPDLVFSSSNHLIDGIVTRAHLGEDSGASTMELLARLPCDYKNNGFRAFDRQLLPPKLHYAAATTRIGDILLLSESGVFLARADTPPEKRAKEEQGSNHGWVYTEPQMRTIFFAMGPAFKKNVRLPPFQNVEYFNLFAEILGIEPPPNNGTIGSLWAALKAPNTAARDPFYAENLSIGKCPMRGGKNSKFDKIVTAMPLGNARELGKNCFTQIDAHFFKISTKLGMGFMERFSRSTAASDQTRTFLVASELETPVPGASTAFFSKFWRPLQEKTRAYLRRFPRMIVVSGWAHLNAIPYAYRVLLRCEDDRWDETGWECFDPESTRIIAFLLPTQFDDFNCLPSDELLFTYTARLRDVETLSGLRFLQKIPYATAVHLKTNITMELW